MVTSTLGTEKAELKIVFCGGANLPKAITCQWIKLDICAKLDSKLLDWLWTNKKLKRQNVVRSAFMSFIFFG